MAMMCSINSLLLLSLAILLISNFSSAGEVTYDGRSIKVDGERKLIISGSIHYPRSTPEMWETLIKKSKDGGLNAIETYVFWNAHEPQRLQYDFSGRLDLVRFIKTIQDEGLYAILRIGPYVCAEWNYGGFPVWLHNLPNIKLRTNNEVFKNEMKRFVTLIVEMMKQEKLFASQGGPIILAQIENEYGNVMDKGSNDDNEYLKWCADLALSYHVGVPWVMCQQKNAPSPMIETANGYYKDGFYPQNRTGVPKMWTENWIGWYTAWGDRIPHRTAEDIAFAVARFYQLNGTLQNYYMYHGGTNFGHTSGGPYITTSYDYDAPLDEYGNLNQPKWGHLKTLHEVIRSVEKILLYGESSTTYYPYGPVKDWVMATVYNYQGERVCFFSNSYPDTDYEIEFEGVKYNVAAWTVSIRPGCYKEVYNTGKVNAQTSMMVKMPNEADDGEEPYKLKWGWRAEKLVNMKNGVVKGSIMTATELLDQKRVANDTSDYLWYITSVDIDQNDVFYGKNITLHVHTNGRGLHVFLNKKFIGSKWAKNLDEIDYVFDKDVKLKLGKNEIALLSVTVGFRNYGKHYFDSRDGARGPVKFITYSDANEEIIKDISSNEWIYKVGLHGEEQQLYKVNSRHFRNWNTRRLPSNRKFVWYKTTFPSPMGDDPVVLDLLGMGKGEAWVNGQSIGRYWPAWLADEKKCSYSCDFHGTYDADKCLSNCGQPTQRWYHVPRSFLNDEGNVLVLFEELGGTPEVVHAETVTIGKVCAHAYDGNTVDLSCQGGRHFSEIKFASFGEPKGTCGSFKKGKCEAHNTLEIIKKACIGKERCSFNVSEDTFGPTSCKCDTYRLAVEAIC